jgi:hypothetical protein
VAKPSSHCSAKRETVAMPSHEWRLVRSGATARSWNLNAAYTPKMARIRPTRWINMCAIFCVRWSIGMVEYARIAAKYHVQVVFISLFSAQEPQTPSTSCSPSSWGRYSERKYGDSGTILLSANDHGTVLRLALQENVTIRLVIFEKEKTPT